MSLGFGLTTFATYTAEFAGNPLGGRKQGGRFADQFLFGLNADVSKLGAWDGFTLHVIGTERNGRSLTNDLVGNSISVQEIFGGGQTYRLAYLSFEQKLLQGRLNLEVGRIPGQGQAVFLADPLYCNFQNNSVCGNPDIAAFDTNYPYFPIATWAGTVSLALTDLYSIYAGAYEVVRGTDTDRDHGIDLLGSPIGVSLPLLLTISPKPQDGSLPGHYGIGAVIDRSPYDDPAIGRDGVSLALTTAEPMRDYGRMLAFQRFDKVVYQPEAESARGLTVFGVLFEAAGGRQTESYYLGVGAVYVGLLGSRPNDAANVFVSTQRYSDVGLTDVRAARRLAGLSPEVATNQTIFELNYGCQLAPGLRLAPNIQYIVDPDQLRLPLRTQPIHDAFVVGLKLSVDLFTFAGLTKDPG